MKMYLSSFRLGDCPEKLFGLFDSNQRIAVIANAIDAAQPDIRKASVAKEIESLSSIGLQADEIDLRNYFGKESDLRSTLSLYGGVWVRGGNTFILNRAASYSGFREIILEMNLDPGFVYAGYSAGIILLTPDLHGTELCDVPELVPEGYQSEIIWEGLNILKYYLAPHYRTANHPESPLIELTVDYYLAHNKPFKTLRDGEVIIYL